MKADQIIKNAKIYTAYKEQPIASALVVKDGKFAYVGGEQACEIGAGGPTVKEMLSAE